MYGIWRIEGASLGHKKKNYIQISHQRFYYYTPLQMRRLKLMQVDKLPSVSKTSPAETRSNNIVRYTLLKSHIPRMEPPSNLYTYVNTPLLNAHIKDIMHTAFHLHFKINSFPIYLLKCCDTQTDRKTGLLLYDSVLLVYLLNHKWGIKLFSSNVLICPPRFITTQTYSLSVLSNVYDCTADYS